MSWLCRVLRASPGPMQSQPPPSCWRHGGCRVHSEPLYPRTQSSAAGLAAHPVMTLGGGSWTTSTNIPGEKTGLTGERRKGLAPPWSSSPLNCAKPTPSKKAHRLMFPTVGKAKPCISMGLVTWAWVRLKAGRNHRQPPEQAAAFLHLLSSCLPRDRAGARC